MKVKEEHDKAGLKLNIQKTKIMAYGPITSWKIDEETMETVTDFIFLGSKITAALAAAMKLKDVIHGVSKSQTRLSDWTELNCTLEEKQWQT